MTYEEFLRQLAGQLEASLSPPDEDGESTLTLSTERGRKQEIRLGSFEEDAGTHVRFYTVIGSARDLSQKRLASALELNTSLLYGAFAIYDGNLVLMDTLDLAGSEAGQGAKVARYLAKTADTFEKMVYGLDRS